jgi:NADPH:quinone reductase-like Zn-dependent oxidoreductase
MKAVRIYTHGGGPDDLVFEDAPDPRPATGDVIVRVHAAGIVPDELSWPGTWTDRAGRDRIPSIPAHEVAGVVAEVRYGTTGWAVGDRVFGLTDWHRDGAAAEFVAVEARNLAAIPGGVDDISAAAIPISGLTAWQGLFTHGCLRAGQTVLVHGAGGSTGALAIQLAREAGARVIATGRASAEETARAYGAERFVEIDCDLFDATTEPVDLVFDTIGGDVLVRSAAIVRTGGTIVSITAPPPAAPEQGRSIYFIVEPDREQLAGLASRVVAGSLQPHIGAIYPLADTRQAFAAKRNGTPGKVVIQV